MCNMNKKIIHLICLILFFFVVCNTTCITQDLGNSGKIVFTRDLDPMNTQKELFVMNLDGTELRQITNLGHKSISSPCVSHDGSKIVFTFHNDTGTNNRLATINIDGSGYKILTDDTKNSRQPTFSRDGTKIIFAKEIASPHYEIYTMNPDGSGLKKLTNTGEWCASPSYSPDNGKIIFHKGTNKRIYVMNNDGSNVRKLYHELNSNSHQYATYSPDGSKIAFEYWDGSTFDIYVMNSDGSNIRQLTFGTDRNMGPAWSFDGNKIAFYRNAGGNQDIYIMNADGTGQRRLTYYAHEDLKPCFVGKPR